MQARSDMLSVINTPSISSNLKSVVKLLITKFEKQKEALFLGMIVIVIPITEAYW